MTCGLAGFCWSGGRSKNLPAGARNQTTTFFTPLLSLSTIHVGSSFGPFKQWSLSLLPSKLRFATSGGVPSNVTFPLMIPKAVGLMAVFSLVVGAPPPPSFSLLALAAPPFFSAPAPPPFFSSPPQPITSAASNPAAKNLLPRARNRDIVQPPRRNEIRPPGPPV